MAEVILPGIGMAPISADAAIIAIMAGFGTIGNIGAMVGAAIGHPQEALGHKSVGGRVGIRFATIAAPISPA